MMVATCIQGQDCFSYSISIEDRSYSIISLMEQFESQQNLTFSYSTSILDNRKQLSFNARNITAKVLLKKIAKTQPISYSCGSSNKILIFRSKNYIPEPVLTRHYGSVYDIESKEKLFGAYILTLNDKPVGITDDKGFYSIVTKVDSIKVQYLGYQVAKVKLNSVGVRNDIGLGKDNELLGVTIQSNIVRDITDIEGDNGVIAFQDVGHVRGYLGDENGLNLMRQKPGVQSGAEGQTGLVIRGGSPDENLYLYNGVPVYEMSHIAGLSSILQSDNIQNIELFKSGMPARYGGRLSSVVNIKTKNGNKLKPEASVAASLSALMTHIEGPIVKDKVSFNFNARQSILGLYINPLVKSVIQYDDINIAYNDYSGNVHFQLSKNDEINIFGYTGNDEISLETIEESLGDAGNYGFIDRNKITWGTRLGGAQYQRIWSDDLVMKVLVSQSLYNITSQATYISDRVEDAQNLRNQLDVVSSSSIKDRKVSIQFDSYLFQFDKLSFGAELIDHSYSPAIVQSIREGSQSPTEILGEIQLIGAREWAAFSEYKNHISKLFKLNMGLRYSRFDSQSTSYDNWEPRVSILSEWSDRVHTRLNYSNTAQYLHLLSNGGGGFPADLWVPVTDDIKPKLANQISLTLETKKLLIDYVSVSIFSKSITGLVDYSGAQDVLFSIVNQENPPIVFKNNTDWQSRVISGDGISRGWELAVQQSFGKFKIEGAYSNVYARNTFKEIDDGAPFVSQYDRPDDIKVNLGWKPLQNWQFNLNFSYGSGSAFTLATSQYLDIEGNVITFSEGRNRERLNSFHHLDLDAKYVKRFDDKRLEFQFGIYNIYNRLNPFYVYLFQEPGKSIPTLRQISLFPIMPSFSIKYVFLD